MLLALLLLPVVAGVLVSRFESSVTIEVCEQPGETPSLLVVAGGLRETRELTGPDRCHFAEADGKIGGGKTGEVAR